MTTRDTAAQLLRSLQATAAAESGVEPAFEPLDGNEILNDRNSELVLRFGNLDLGDLLGPTLPILDRNIYLGSLIGIRANGFAYELKQAGHDDPTEDALIVCNTGLFNLLNLAVKSIALLVESSIAGWSEVETEALTRSKYLTKIKETIAPEAETRFLDLVMSYARFGDPAKAAPYTTYRADSMMGHFWPQLQFAERFVVAHEYGHIAKGSLAGPMIWEVRARGQNRPEDQHPEHTADDIGFKLLVSHALFAHRANSWNWHEDGETPMHAITTAWAGTMLLFSMMSIVDQTVSLLATGDENAIRDDSYPTPEARLVYIASRFGDVVGPEVVEVMMGSSVTDAILDELWRRVRPSVVEAHTHGIRPAIPMLPSSHAHLGDPRSPAIAQPYPYLTVLEWWASDHTTCRKVAAEILFGMDYFTLQEFLRETLSHGDQDAARTVARFLSTIDADMKRHIDRYAFYDFEKQWDLTKRPLLQLFPDGLRDLALTVDPSLRGATRVADIADDSDGGL